MGGEGGGERAQPFRLKGPAIEIDQARCRDRRHRCARASGAERERGAVRHRAAARGAGESGEPDRRRALLALNALSQSGTLEILPPEAPLVLFIWSASRVVPVRVTEFSITEEAFDAALNPIRAKVSLGLRVMTTDDLGFDHRGGGIFINHLRTREALAGKTGAASLQSLGLSSRLAA